MDCLSAAVGRNVDTPLGSLETVRGDMMTSLTDVSPLITAGVTLLTLGIGIGKLLYDVAFLKRKAGETESRLASLEKEQIGSKLILKQVAKKLKISY